MYGGELLHTPVYVWADYRITPTYMGMRLAFLLRKPRQRATCRQ